MVKTNKNTGGKGHNKVASVLLIAAGLFLAGLPFTVNYLYFELKVLMVAGIVMVILGGILFNKSFLK